MPTRSCDQGIGEHEKEARALLARIERPAKAGAKTSAKAVRD